MRKLLPTIVGVVVAGLLLAACGGDDDDAGDDAGGDAESLPADEFIEQADALCQETGDTIDEKIAAVLEDNPELAQAESIDDIPDEVIDEIIDTGVSEYESLISELRQIAPEGDEDTWADLLDQLDDAVDEVESDPRSFLGSAESPFEDARAGAQELGLQVCGSA